MGSYKRDIYIRAMLDGAAPEEAAAEAGYTPKYGRQLARLPDVQRTIERKREYEQRKAAADPEEHAQEELTPAGVLRDMAYDPTLTPQVRIQAIRVLGMLEKESGERAARIPAAVIIDDIPLGSGEGE